MVLDVMNQFDFFSAVPLGGSATIGDVARTTTLPESVVRRVIRHAATLRIFTEYPPGSDNIIHTATSAHVAKTPLKRSWLSHQLEEVRPGTVCAPESLRLYSAGKEKPTEDVTEAGFALADIDRTGHTVPFWDYLKTEVKGKPEGYRSQRFSEAMQMAGQTAAISPSDVLKAGFDWASLGAATIIDVSPAKLPILLIATSTGGAVSCIANLCSAPWLGRRV
jgi:hypothetical protein